MALDTIPPWLYPPNFVGAMSAGSSEGLKARQQDIDQGQAADRLRLAYDQLAKNERVAQMQASNRLGIAQMQNEIRRAHEDALQQHYADMLASRQGSIEQQSAMMDLRQKNADAMADFRQKTLDNTISHQKDVLDLNTKIAEQREKHREDLTAEREKTKFRYEGGQWYKMTDSGPVPVDSGEAKDKIVPETRGTYNPLRVTDYLGLTSPPLTLQRSTNTPASSTVIAPDFVPKQYQAAPPPTVKTQADYDALPSGTIYISDDGKKHRKP